MQFVTQPFGDLRLGEFLLNHLAELEWTTFRAAIAFVKRSGTQYLRPALTNFSSRADVRISAGIDFYGSSREGLNDLLEATQAGQVLIYRNSGPYTFHPKVYLFKSAQHADIVVGSGNLTEGGLFTNYEASLAVSLDLSEPEDAAFLQIVEATLDQWAQPKQGLCYVLNAEFLEQLVVSGLVRSEAELAARQKAAEAQQPPVEESDVESAVDTVATIALFTAFAVPKPPAIPPSVKPNALTISPSDLQGEEAEAIVTAAAEAGPSVPTCVISVLSVDLPVQGSSNEVTITKYIRDVLPGFWGWTVLFEGPDATTGQYRRNIRIRYGQKLISAYLLDFPARKPAGTKASADFRLGSIAPIVADLKQEDDLLILSQSAEADVDYLARVVRVGEAEHEELMNGMEVYSRSRSNNGIYRKFRYLS